MRGLLGGVILVAGVGGLGWFASQGPAKDIESQIKTAADEIAGGAPLGVAADVSGRDITVTGMVQDEDAVAALRAAFDEIPGRRVLNVDGVETLPVASPFVLSAVKNADGIALTGNVPSQAAADALGGELTLANGAPDAAWADVMATTIAAMDTLEEGSFAASDTALTVTGAAANPDALAAFEAAVADIPAPYTVSSDITLLDDGTPLRLAAQFDGATLTGEGKLPAGLTAADLGAGDWDVTDSILPDDNGDFAAATGAGIAAVSALMNGTLAIEGATVAVAGEGSPDDIAAAEAALAALPDGYTAASNLTLFDDGVPFSLSVQSDANGLTANGKVPADFDASLLDGAQGDVATAFITDETGTWPAIADAGFAALAALENGGFDVADGTITLTGTAMNPDAQAAAQAALAGFDADMTFDLLDDGAPISLDLVYSDADGASLSGKLPANVEVDDVAAALGIDVVDAGATQSGFESDADLVSPLAALRGLLPEMSGFAFAATEDASQLDATAAPGVNPAALALALQDAVGEGTTVAAVPMTDLPAEGATRVNRFTGQDEAFTAGNWLPTFTFFATPESCTAKSEEILAENQVAFLSGSAELDVTSVRAINALSGLARKCALEGGIFLTVLGHTDNSGDPEANTALSQERADVVRNALLARGLARSVVSAIGLGDSQPIADNATEEGRAANRRTEFNWNYE